MHSLKADIDTKTIEKELLLSTNKELRDLIHALDGDGIQRPDGTFMNRCEFVEFKEGVDSSWKASIASKQEIARVWDNISELKRAEASLRSEVLDLRARFEEEEEKAGVAGFRVANEQLERTGKQTANANKLKSRTLDDISAMVQNIARTLEEKKEDLEPKVCL